MQGLGGGRHPACRVQSSLPRVIACRVRAGFAGCRGAVHDSHSHEERPFGLQAQKEPPFRAQPCCLGGYIAQEGALDWKELLTDDSCLRVTDDCASLHAQIVQLTDSRLCREELLADVGVCKSC